MSVGQTEEEGQDMGQDIVQDTPDDDKDWGPYTESPGQDTEAVSSNLPLWLIEEMARRKAAGQDRTTTIPGPELAAFMAVVQDRVPDAQDVVSRMSRKERALLSSYLRELGSVVDTQDMRDTPN